MRVKLLAESGQAWPIIPFIFELIAEYAGSPQIAVGGALGLLGADSQGDQLVQQKDQLKLTCPAVAMPAVGIGAAKLNVTDGGGEL